MSTDERTSPTSSGESGSPRARNIAVALALILVAVAIVAVTFVAGRRDPGPNRWPDDDLGADRVVVYKQTPTRELHLHVFEPKGRPTAAAVLFHGGGFERTPIDQFVSQSRALADNGVVAFIAEYRVRSDDVENAEIVKDARDAVQFVTDHALDYRFPEDKVIAMGASAGGMLAATTETADPAQAGPEALVLYNPAISARLANPKIPVLVFHGDADQTVPLSSARSYCADAATCELVTFPDQDHGFFNTEPYLTQTTDLMLDFLRQEGFMG